MKRTPTADVGVLQPFLIYNFFAPSKIFLLTANFLSFGEFSPYSSFTVHPVIFLLFQVFRQSSSVKPLPTPASCSIKTSFSAAATWVYRITAHTCSHIIYPFSAKFFSYTQNSISHPVQRNRRVKAKHSEIGTCHSYRY